MPYQTKTWWHTDPEGQRIGYMHPNEFDALLALVYPKGNPRQHFAEDMGLNTATVVRYATGVNPIPRYMAVMVLMIAGREDPTAPLPPVVAPWLNTTKDTEDA